jgi:hypothetical protein
MINPKEQRNACEFGQGRPTDYLAVFTGEFQHTIRGIAEGYESLNIEPFSTIHAISKEFPCIADSFAKLTQSETLNRDRNIDKSTYSNVCKSKQLLKSSCSNSNDSSRVESISKDFTHVRFPMRFEFPPEIDICAIMAASDGTEHDTLTGAVLHSGTDQRDHFTSLIKFDNQEADSMTSRLPICTKATLELLLFAAVTMVVNARQPLLIGHSTPTSMPQFWLVIGFCDLISRSIFFALKV